MESKEEREARHIKLFGPDWIEPTKENFFEIHKPVSTTEVLLESGETVTSETVIGIIKKIKRLMEQGDVDGFRYLVNKSPEIKAITNDERSLLADTVITEKGETLFRVIMETDDLGNP